MTTKELLRVKDNMVIFGNSIPLSNKLLDETISFLASINLVNTFLLKAILLDKKMGNLKRVDKNESDRINKELDYLLDKIEDYLMHRKI